MQKWRYRLVSSVQPCIPFTVLNIVQPLGKFLLSISSCFPSYTGAISFTAGEAVNNKVKKGNSCVEA